MASYSTSMSITKVLHLAQMQVSKPSDQTVTLMVCVCSFDANASTLASSTKYMLRFLMNPSYSGGSFGASTSWRDVTPYYIDKVYTNKLLTKPDAANDKRYTFPTAADEYYFAEDLVGAYIYVEDASFATPSVHIAEGDKITSSDHTWHDFTSATMSINTESNHPGSFSTWGGVTMDVLRIHKNLETGKIPYDQLCSDSSTFFDQYTFSSEIKNERIILSMHTGDSGRANMTLGFNYVSHTHFSTGNIKGLADYIYNAASDVMYDKRLVYGFPNYDNINKSNVDTVFDGKTIQRWNSGTLPSAAASGTATVSTNGYQKIAGQITLGSGFVAANLTNNLYKILSCDVSIVTDDFIVSEFDVHGRYGGFTDFQARSNRCSGNIQFMPAGSSLLSHGSNFSEYEGNTFEVQGLATSGSERPFSPSTGYITSVTVTGAGTGYTSPPKVSFSSGTAKATATINGGGNVTSINMVDGGYGYDPTNPPDVILEGGGYTTIATATAVIATRVVPINLSLYAKYDGYRYGLHEVDDRYGGTYTSSLVGTSKYYHVAGAPVLLPSVFNRNIRAIDIGAHQGGSACGFFEENPSSPLSSKIVIEDLLASDWDFTTFFYDNISAPTILNENFCYTKVFRIDENVYNKANLGGSILAVTGNPSFSYSQERDNDKSLYVLCDYRPTDLGYVKEGSLMAKDYSFGAKYQVILRDRLFMAVCKYQEYQRSVIQTSIFEDNENVFMSPIAEFGGNYHTYDANTLKIPAKEIAPITGLAVVNIPQGLQGSTQADRNQLLILGERGYKYVEIGDSGPTNERSYNGDCCVAPKSVVYDSGLAFCAGNNGVYMFQASEKTDITMMGASKINKTWRSLSRSVKQTAIGVFNKDRGIYMLAIPSTNTIYCFDLRETQIYTFSYADSIHFAKLIQAGFHINKLWLAFNDGVTSYMDDSVATDWDGNNNDSITASFTLNNINPDGKYTKIEQFGLGYTATGNISPTVYVDGSSYSLTESSGTNKYIERSIKKNFNSRGRQFSFSLSGSTISEVFDLDVTFADVVQKKLIRGELN